MPLAELETALRSVDIRRFTRALSRYLRSAEALDQTLAALGEVGAASEDPLAGAVAEIDGEGEHLLTRISVAVNHLVYVGPDPVPVNVAPAFRKIRRQQIELLSAVGDDIELIRDTVRRSHELQRVFQDQSERLRRAATLLDVIHQRFRQRPTTLLQLAGRDEKIQELNQTFQEINLFEDERGRAMAAETSDGPVNGALGEYRTAAGQAYGDLTHRRDRIQRRSKELAEGRRLLMTMARKGLSPWRRHRVNVLFRRHEGRALRFRNEVRDLRSQYFVEHRVPSP